MRRTVMLFLVLPLIFDRVSTSELGYEKLLDEQKIIKKLLESPENDYDWRVRPRGSVVPPGDDDNDPVIITVNMYLRSISKVDDVNMEYSLHFTFREEWVDERLFFNSPTLKHIVLSPGQRIWVPDTFFQNEKDGKKHDIDTPNILIRVYNGTGRILYSVRLTLTLSCPMRLADYPLDVQTCVVDFASYAYTTKDIAFIFGALLEFALVNWAARQDHSVRSSRAKQNQMHLFFRNQSLRHTETHPFFSATQSDVVLEEVPYNWWDKVWKIRYKEHSRRIDLLSRVMFPLFFMLFNITYWWRYLLPYMAVQAQMFKKDSHFLHLALLLLQLPNFESGVHEPVREEANLYHFLSLDFKRNTVIMYLARQPEPNYLTLNTCYQLLRRTPRLGTVRIFLRCRFVCRQSFVSEIRSPSNAKSTRGQFHECIT
ncbi:hypothetical protein Q1695_010673 [Nippostrongylus brasiliensis]|nr:hypothetical protein Q1695_010673 [Nippostrongylus brasiliensis]